jgi:hypothetical protein
MAYSYVGSSPRSLRARSSASVSAFCGPLNTAVLRACPALVAGLLACAGCASSRPLVRPRMRALTWDVCDGLPRAFLHLPSLPSAAGSAPCTRASTRRAPYAVPRMLNCRNPSTFLIQPLGGSAIHLRFAVGRLSALLGLELGGHRRGVWVLLGVDLGVLLAFAAKGHHHLDRQRSSGFLRCGSRRRPAPSSGSCARGCSPTAWIIGSSQFASGATLLINSAATMMCAASSTAVCAL